MPPVSSQKQPQQPNTPAPASAPSPAPATPAATSSTPAPTAAAAPTTPVATSEPLREDQVKLAVKFLSSPKVQSADHSKKLAFLKQKGLTQAEIDEAFKRTSGTAASAPTSAPPAATSTAPAASAPTTSQRLTIKRIVAIALLVGTSAVGLTAGLVSLVKCYMIPVFKRIAGYQRGRYEEHHDHYKQLEAQ
ncbi:peroxisomal membrane anchor protein conserved region-domain-containing protein, partial [Gongronella butleri]